jgi:hypothetical protein
MTLLRALLVGLVVTTAHAAPPTYRVGDTYIYSDRRVETVAELKGREVVWRAGSGQRFTRPLDFFVPATEWKTKLSRGRRTIRGTPERLWPLEARQTVRFRVSTEVRDERDRARRVAELWVCTAAGAERLRIPAGLFDTELIRCDRYSPDTMRVQQRVLWHYAPDVGHYVRREAIEFGTGEHRIAELVAEMHGRQANAGAIRSILAGLPRK